MVNTNYSVASTLSGIYNTNATSMTETLSKLASGKRVQNASDDFAGYVKASTYNGQVAAYDVLKQNMQDSKSKLDYAKTVGNQVVDSLSRMSELATMYGSGDANQQAAYSAEFTQLKNNVTNAISSAEYNGSTVYQAGQLANVSTNAENTSHTIDATTTAVADASGLTIAGGAAAITTQLNNARTYLTEVSGFSKAIDNAMKLADTAVASKKAAISAITDVDEVKEMANLTNLQVRNTAAVSMMSQANMSQQGLARLFM